ncbi:PKD domain-containing protein [Candidatus Gracilibacteria bacterium]|nr:PKD domain-containing protein [Candidatus Gracilibacteria bacterium]NUJ98414.1 PKD domain-containing protein [Candidatus Gracilibacteria bacterium]
MLKKLIAVLLISASLLGNGGIIFAAKDDEVPSYTTLREIDKGTFNEYRYRITEKYFSLKENFNIEGTIDKDIALDIQTLAEKGYKYLPDNLNNKNYYNNLVTEIKRGIKYPDNETNYTTIVKAIQAFLEKTDIKTIAGTIEALPKEGNAPLTVTLRAKVSDPTGTQIPSYNYIWWIDNGGKRQEIGRKLSLSYVLKEEGKYSIFLDVVSNHKNEAGFTDVLPFRSRTDIEVKEKVASLILSVNGDKLRNQDILKFTPNEASYGLIFDATSSTPTGGAKFIKTSWDFGNGVKREYTGAPKVERVVYATEGEYTVKLTLKTNELKSIERKFVVSVHQPIATISSNTEEGYMGTEFVFKAKPSGNDKNLSYNWEIVDIDNDEVLIKKTGSVLNQTFLKKGKYNIKLKVVEPSGDTDTDTKIININSRAPIANFTYKIPKQNEPNTVLLDASKTYDLDFSDEGNLKFSWIIDGQKVNLEKANYNGSVGYYTFDSIGDHSVVLEVKDPDDIIALKSDKVTINSVLSVDVHSFPKVIQRQQSIRFVADSEYARYYEWEFGDGDSYGGKTNQVSHTYNKSGIFDVKLTVRDNEGVTNSVITKVYVSESDSPLALIDISKGYEEIPVYDKNACDGAGAYIVDKVSNIRLSGLQSINVDGEATGLTYSWKIGNNKYSSGKDVTHTFDELGCFPIKLTVKSDKGGKTSSAETMISVENLKPVLSSLEMEVVDANTDPVVVNVKAVGAKDPDGVIQSYLWYYYTDMDNEPQDFRSTVKPTTTFVLPKVSGNYYFVLILKDNNEARITSDEATGSKFFTTLAGDNMNTPLIELKVNDSSVTIGDDVVYTANVKNVLGQDIATGSEFNWDFDGDGFYDKTTKENTTTYKFSKSGEYASKVKVKYKGFSNVRNVTINVSNKLEADFDYISIGSKFIFLDKSSGKIDNIQWDLGDGEKVSGRNSFTHIYTDAKKTHNVVLKISEGTKVKEITKEVETNIKNILKAKKTGLNLFTYPAYDDTNTINLESDTQKVYGYLGDSNASITYYAVDYDREYDSDLNGGKDDDDDNKSGKEYKTGDPIEIPLSKNKTQKIRFMIRDEAGVVLDSEDITIVKKYIKEDTINLDEVNFPGVTGEEKEKVDALKKLVSNLPENYKIEGMKYIQKLQEEWYDDTEKTKVILEFEDFLDNKDITNASEIVEVLESILVIGQNDKSEKNIAYNALKGLIPDILTCEKKTTGTCKQYIISQLDKIKTSKDIEKNKKIGTEILAVIEKAVGMSDKEKLDFKAVLKTFIYGGVDNIPSDEKQEVKDDNTASSGGIFMKILKFVLYIFGGILFILVGGALVFWILYKVKNEDEEVSFQDFILRQTSGKAGKKEEDDEDDIFADNSSGEKKDIFKEEVVVDTPKKVIQEEDDEEEETPTWLKGADNINTKEQNTKIETPISEGISGSSSSSFSQEEEEEGEIPSWLQGPDSLNTEEKKQLLEDQDTTTKLPLDETNIGNSSNNSSQEEEEKVPDWLKGSFGEETKSEDKKTEQEEDIFKKEENLELPQEKDDEINEEESSSLLQTDDTTSNTKKEDIDSLTTLDDTDVPDWLKGSFGEETKETSEESDDDGESLIIQNDNEKEQVISDEQKELAKEKSSSELEETPDWLKTQNIPQEKQKEEENIPDWLKAEDLVVGAKKEAKDMDIPDWLKGSLDEKEEKKEKKKTSSKKTTKKKDDEKAEQDATKKDELWQDGMQVPDWLQDTGDNKKNS